MIRIFISGRHSRRLPFSYRALAPLFDGQVALVDSPDKADLYLFAHVLDIQDTDLSVVRDWRARRCPVVLMSEEPFWDTIWCRRPLRRELRVETRFGALPVLQLNHQTSEIFRFDAIPYYLLTNHRFATSYLYRFQRNTARSEAEWRTAFADRAQSLTFMFERRPELYHNVRWDKAGLIGLCAWRTDLAECFGPEEAERLGHSWQGGPRRFDLKNWHLDKLMRLDDRSRSLAALENTHQPNYITEKLFDAFACGALPLYYADPGHRVHDFALPTESWLNLYGLSPTQAAERIRALPFDAAFFEAFQIAQHQLADRFAETGLWVDERVRLRAAVLLELTRALEAG